jgi:hypothetical protein
MITHDRSKRLQEVADYRTVRKTLRGGGIGSAVFGGLGVGLGLVSPTDPILVAVGAVLLGTGLWNIFAPRPQGIILDGLTLVMVGVYNVAGVFLNIAQGESGAGGGIWVKLGVFQIIWGIQSFWRYAQFRNAFTTSVSGTELLELDTMATALWKSRAKDTDTIVEFDVSGLRAARWKVRLDPDMVLLATEGGAEVRVSSRDAIEIEDRGKVMLGKSRKATIRIGAKTLKGTIKPESLQRFQQWKGGFVLPEAIAA